MKRAGVVVRFSPADIARLTALAVARDGAKSRSQNRRVALQFGDQRLNLYGLMGEEAVCRYLDLPLDSSISRAGDVGWDFELPDGRTGQVKFNTYVHGDLYIGGPSRLEADLLVLVVPHSPTSVRIMGWVTRQQFIERSCARDYGHGGRRAVSQRDLEPIETLRAEPAKQGVLI